MTHSDIRERPPLQELLEAAEELASDFEKYLIEHGASDSDARLATKRVRAAIAKLKPAGPRTQNS